MNKMNMDQVKSMYGCAGKNIHIKYYPTIVRVIGTCLVPLDQDIIKFTYIQKESIIYFKRDLNNCLYFKFREFDKMRIK